MTPFWFLIGGLGVMWFITTGRAQAVLVALTGAVAATSAALPTSETSQLPSGSTAPYASPATATPGTGNDPLPVDTAPTISPAQINQVLARYNSPAAGLGQTFYDQGVAHGINPAVALAFFVHESQAGTAGIARFTNSIGNIRALPGQPSYEGFRQYTSWQEGIADYYRLIRETYINSWGLHTVDSIIPRYAPAADHNNEASYIQTVKDLVRGWLRGPVP